MRRKRRNHKPAFKAKVALTALKGDRTLAVGGTGKGEPQATGVTGARYYLRDQMSWLAYYSHSS